MIALPSAHIGGDVRVELGSERRTLSTAVGSDFNFSYLGWYADVNHTVEPVVSGYRLVLTYNIVYSTSDASLRVSLLDDHKHNLIRVLAAWKKCWGAEKLIYMLEHAYSEANISLDLLKGKDKARIRYLFPRSFEHTVMGGAEEEEEDRYGYGSFNRGGIHEIIDVCDEDWKLTKVFTPNGKHIAGNIEVDQDEILQEGVFGGEPDDEDYEGWTGNEGATATHIYRRTCAMIVPNEKRFDLIMGKSSSRGATLASWIEILLEETDDEIRGEDAEDDIVMFCGTMMHHVPDKTLDVIVRAALEIEKPKLFEDAARAVTRSLSLSLFEEIGHHLAERNISLWLPRDVFINVYSLLADLI